MLSWTPDICSDTRVVCSNSSGCQFISYNSKGNLLHLLLPIPQKQGEQLLLFQIIMTIIIQTLQYYSETCAPWCDWSSSFNSLQGIQCHTWHTMQATGFTPDVGMLSSVSIKYMKYVNISRFSKGMSHNTAIYDQTKL